MLSVSGAIQLFFFVTTQNVRMVVVGMGCNQLQWRSNYLTKLCTTILLQTFRYERFRRALQCERRNRFLQGKRYNSLTQHRLGYFRTPDRLGGGGSDFFDLENQCTVGHMPI